MLRLRLDGRTYFEIAKQAGVSRQRIQQILSPPPEIRNYITRKFSNHCAQCGVLIKRKGDIHHIKLSDEDYEDIENLELLCVSCHQRKHWDKLKEFQKGL